MSENNSCVVYDSQDIRKIYRCGVNEIATLQKAGVIPLELRQGFTRRRRWSRAVVNKSLGFPIDVDLTQECTNGFDQEKLRGVVRELVAEELNRITPQQG